MRLALMSLSLFLIAANSDATVFFAWDSENQACGARLSFYVDTPGREGYTACAQAPQGSKYLEWRTENNWNQAYTEMAGVQGLPLNLSLGTTYYLAFHFNFTRINGLDVWREFSGTSADKAYEIVGSGIRWIVMFGQMESACYKQNQDHKFTAWIMNGSYHLNPSKECVDQFVQNVSNYSGQNPIQLDYDMWHTGVMAIKMTTNSTGSATLYIDGKKVLEYLNIITSGAASPTISSIKMGGTIAQPAYDAPAHYRKFDSLLLTNNWQDILNGGYMSGNSPPLSPQNLIVK